MRSILDETGFVTFVATVVSDAVPSPNHRRRTKSYRIRASDEMDALSRLRAKIGYQRRLVAIAEAI